MYISGRKIKCNIHYDGNSLRLFVHGWLQVSNYNLKLYRRLHIVHLFCISMVQIIILPVSLCPSRQIWNINETPLLLNNLFQLWIHSKICTRLRQRVSTRLLWLLLFIIIASKVKKFSAKQRETKCHVAETKLHTEWNKIEWNKTIVPRIISKYFHHLFASQHPNRFTVHHRFWARGRARIARQQAQIKPAIIAGSDVSARRDATKVADGSERFTASWHFQLWKVWEFAGRIRLSRLGEGPRDPPNKCHLVVNISIHPLE